MSATPRPWKRHARNRHHVITETREGGARKLIASVATHTATFSPEEWDANADLIVRAVNAHDDLVAALKTLLADMQDYEPWQRPCHAVDKARAALARAKGEPDEALVRRIDKEGRL